MRGSNSLDNPWRHCEERSDAAIQSGLLPPAFAGLAMTGFEMRRFAFVALPFALAACATTPRPVAQPAGPVQVQILAINDFHGNLEPSTTSVEVTETSGGAKFKAKLGGAAQLATTLKALRFFTAPNSITVAAGDLVGASPISSALFLDEPTIDALGMVGLDLASVGNHEFDKGSGELLRMQNGGCEKFTRRVPCRLEPFKGAGFQYLGANVLKADGTTLFPATAIRHVGPLKIGFIGMTLKDTGTLVSPAGVAGLRFSDEAATANGLVPKLKAEGADLIVLLIHQGGKVPETYVRDGCAGLSGAILPILDRLDPAVRIVVSGHTHHAYACEVGEGGNRRLLTSAGKYGYLVTDIRLMVDPATKAVLGWQARNATVDDSQGIDPKVAALVTRYHDAAAGEANRPVGRLAAAVHLPDDIGKEGTAAELIADAQLFVAKDASRGNAEFALMNNGGARTDLLPAADGTVTFGQIFAMQPFANNIVTKSYTGAEIKAVLEQQFASGHNTVEQPNLLMPSANFRFSVDKSRPDGQRIVAMTLNDRSIDPAKTYRIAVNNFMASGGDNFTLLAGGRDPVDAGLDLDATEAYLATNPPVPVLGRITDLTPKDWVPPKN
jgi:5'-nucleotidase